jgi:hypothetical protein
MALIEITMILIVDACGVIAAIFALGPCKRTQDLISFTRPTSPVTSRTLMPCG